jgi:phosphoribosylformylglycinamidine synthase
MIRNTHAKRPAGRAVGLQGQRRGHRRARRALFPDPDGPYRARRAVAHPDEGRDAQPPDRDLAVSPARRPGSAARSATKARPAAAASRRPASPASPCRTCASPDAPALGATARQARASPRARHHARGPARRRRVQQRVRPPASPATSAPSSSATARRPALRGYHKPIMIAGGLGKVARPRREGPLPSATRLVVLGGPAMLIGLGGGAASSMAPGASAKTSTSPRCSATTRDGAPLPGGHRPLLALGDDNPILSIHDVGAGGLSNAMPELVHDGGSRRRASTCARAERRARHVAARDLVQRGAGALRARARGPRTARALRAICERERCPYAVVGDATAERTRLVVDADPTELASTSRRPRAGRPAARRAARQAAAHAPRREARARAAARARARRRRPWPRRRAACSRCRRSRTRRS